MRQIAYALIPNTTRIHYLLNHFYQKAIHDSQSLPHHDGSIRCRLFTQGMDENFFIQLLERFLPSFPPPPTIRRSIVEDPTDGHPTHVVYHDNSDNADYRIPYDDYHRYKTYLIPLMRGLLKPDRQQWHYLHFNDDLFGHTEYLRHPDCFIAPSRFALMIASYYGVLKEELQAKKEELQEERPT